MLQKDSTSHQILTLLSTKTEVHSKEILAISNWAFGTRSNRGAMGTLMSNGYVERIRRGVYQITASGRNELNKLENR
jgi:predicted transcriptional regulator